MPANIGVQRGLARLGPMLARSRRCLREAYPWLGGTDVASWRLEPLFSSSKLYLTLEAPKRIVVSLRWAGVAQG